MRLILRKILLKVLNVSTVVVAIVMAVQCLPPLLSYLAPAFESSPADTTRISMPTIMEMVEQVCILETSRWIDYVIIEDSIVEGRGIWFDAGLEMTMFIPGTVYAGVDMSESNSVSFEFDTLDAARRLTVHLPNPSITACELHHEEIHETVEEWGVPGLSNEARREYTSVLHTSLESIGRSQLMLQAVEEGILDDVKRQLEVMIPAALNELGYSLSVEVQFPSSRVAEEDPGTELSYPAFIESLASSDRSL